jgi:DNA-directed RNA polymerase specialized sigma24 family protein
LKKSVPPLTITVSSFTAWLRNEVINSCIEQIKEHTKKEEPVQVSPAHEAPVYMLENTSQMLNHKEVLKSIQALSSIYKLIYNLFVIEGFSHAEIAYKINISKSSSACNLFKARQSLLQHLNKRNFISAELINLCSTLPFLILSRIFFIIW